MKETKEFGSQKYHTTNFRGLEHQTNDHTIRKRTSEDELS